MQENAKLNTRTKASFDHEQSQGLQDQNSIDAHDKIVDNKNQMRDQVNASIGFQLESRTSHNHAAGVRPFTRGKG